MDYFEAYDKAVKRARETRRDFAIMRTVFGDFTTFMLAHGDTAERMRYEVVTPESPRVEGGRS